MARANVTFLTVLCLHGLLVSVKSHLTRRDKEEIVTTHNHLRREFARGAQGVVVSNMRKLEWNPHLEQVAQQTLNFIQCTRTLRTFASYIRSYVSNWQRDSEGNFTGDIISWYTNITRQFLPDYHVCHPYQDCASAYKLLGADHHSVGCAYKRNCGGSNVLLCLYSGESKVPFYKSGPICTHCDDSKPFCDDGLCVACDRANGQCDCRKTCSKPNVGQGVLDNSTCTCQCQYGLGPNCDEPCVNREMYVDYDICEEVTQAMCDIPEYNDMLLEFCPAVCHCRSFPTG